MRRQLMAVIAVVAIVACGKHDAGGSAGSASGAPPPAGATVGSGAATIALPAGVDASKITIAPRPATGELPAPLAPYKEMLAKNFKTLALVELGPDGTKLPASGAVTVAIDPAQLGDRPLSQVLAFSVGADGTLEELATTPAGPDKIRVDVKHFSLLGVVVAISTLAIAAGLVSYMKGASDSIARKDCSNWITPTSPRVAEIAKDDAKFSIDKATNVIHLDPALRGKDVDQGAHLLKADQVLERGHGDCVNLSTVIGSLLAAKGYPVRLVAGGAHYTNTAGTKVQGFHQWAETVVDGKPYYVDTFTAPHLKLVPLHEATAELSLTRGRMCGANGGGPYDAHWYDAQEAAPGDDWVKLKSELDDLLEQHKKLVKLCQVDNNACNERKKVYERAKAIQDKLAAMGK